MRERPTEFKMPKKTNQESTPTLPVLAKNQRIPVGQDKALSSAPVISDLTKLFEVQKTTILKKMSDLRPPEPSKTKLRGRVIPTQFKVNMPEFRGKLVGKSHVIKSAVKDRYFNLATSHLLMAFDCSSLAEAAIDVMDIPNALDLILQAERAVGAADAYSSVKEIDSSLAKISAKIMHKQVGLKKRITEYWKAHCPPEMSGAGAAAQIYAEKVIKNRYGVPFAYKTIYKYVLEAKKGKNKV